MHPTAPDVALAELKHWLAITTTADDAGLAALLLSALDMCEAFTGQRPLVADVEEGVAADGTWQALLSRPVIAIGPVDLPASQYEIDIDLHGVGRIRARAPGVRHVSVTLTAGIAGEWSGLPQALRHGVVRLAAALFRNREGDPSPVPPAAVAALWQPYRRMALS